MSRVTGGKRPALLISIALVAAALAGCGGDDGSARQSQQGRELGAPINLADCRDWNAGTVEERLGTIHGIREFLGGPVPGTGGTGRTLDDEQAYDLFEGWCRNEFARGFKLYKLYARAAAFAGAPAPTGE
jgi:hypothetical protein